MGVWKPTTNYTTIMVAEVLEYCLVCLNDINVCFGLQARARYPMTDYCLRAGFVVGKSGINQPSSSNVRVRVGVDRPPEGRVKGMVRNM